MQAAASPSALLLDGRMDALLDAFVPDDDDLARMHALAAADLCSPPASPTPHARPALGKLAGLWDREDADGEAEDGSAATEDPPDAAEPLQAGTAMGSACLGPCVAPGVAQPDAVAPAEQQQVAERAKPAKLRIKLRRPRNPASGTPPRRAASAAAHSAEMEPSQDAVSGMTASCSAAQPVLDPYGRTRGSRIAVRGSQPGGAADVSMQLPETESAATKVTARAADASVASSGVQQPERPIERMAKPQSSACNSAPPQPPLSAGGLQAAAAAEPPRTVSPTPRAAAAPEASSASEVSMQGCPQQAPSAGIDSVDASRTVTEPRGVSDACDANVADDACSAEAPAPLTPATAAATPEPHTTWDAVAAGAADAAQREGERVAAAKRAAHMQASESQPSNPFKRSRPVVSGGADAKRARATEAPRQDAVAADGGVASVTVAPAASVAAKPAAMPQSGSTPAEPPLVPSVPAARPVPARPAAGAAVKAGTAHSAAPIVRHTPSKSLDTAPLSMCAAIVKPVAVRQPQQQQLQRARPAAPLLPPRPPPGPPPPRQAKPPPIAPAVQASTRVSKPSKPTDPRVERRRAASVQAAAAPHGQPRTACADLQQLVTLMQAPAPAPARRSAAPPAQSSPALAQPQPSAMPQPAPPAPPRPPPRQWQPVPNVMMGAPHGAPPVAVPPGMMAVQATVLVPVPHGHTPQPPRGPPVMCRHVESAHAAAPPMQRAAVPPPAPPPQVPERAPGLGEELAARERDAMAGAGAGDLSALLGMMRGNEAAPLQPAAPSQQQAGNAAAANDARAASVAAAPPARAAAAHGATHDMCLQHQQHATQHNDMAACFAPLPPPPPPPPRCRPPPAGNSRESKALHLHSATPLHTAKAEGCSRGKGAQPKRLQSMAAACSAGLQRVRAGKRATAAPAAARQRAAALDGPKPRKLAYGECESRTALASGRRDTWGAQPSNAARPSLQKAPRTHQRAEQSPGQHGKGARDHGNQQRSELKRERSLGACERPAAAHERNVRHTAGKDERGGTSGGTQQRRAADRAYGKGRNLEGRDEQRRFDRGGGGVQRGTDGQSKHGRCQRPRAVADEPLPAVEDLFGC